MKKAIIFTIVFLLVVGMGFSQEFSLKVGAGIGTISGGDLADGLNGLSDLLKAWYGSSGEFAFPHFGLNFSAELVYHFSPNMGAGLGLGYFSSGKESPVTYPLNDLHVKHTLHPRGGVVPITATFHYYPAFSSKIKLDLGAGLALYLAHFNHDERIDISTRTDGTLEYTFASGGRLGFGLHAGVNVEYPLSSKLALIAGILGRFASVTLSSSDWTEKGTGVFGDYNESGNDHKAWYYEWISGTAGRKTYPQVIFGKDAPEGSDVANVREAKLGLTGFLFSLGIRIGL